MNKKHHSAIGVFGGTFDPIHLGHLHLALTFHQQFQLQKILFIPGYQPPLRPSPIATAEQRLEMIKIAIQDYPYFIADDREIKRKGHSYTIDTLRDIRQQVGETPLCFIMAADQFAHFTQWHEWQKIPELAHLIIANRLGYPFHFNDEINALLKQRQTTDSTQLTQQKAGTIFLQQFQPLAISATTIRLQIHQGKNPQRFLPAEVWAYISSHNIYSDRI